ncbi:sulfatase-like hydrolase/transferase [Ramlibacter sp. AW1]|uniref:Sulfatase-like hydrolase/transferase n=1 Tax=Ramlibacter aurantiacus TaxID=2801330 RepID=A0A936ZH67_9BURK|nr:sulfatase-like hydrolase/transferase [Ramlibacter aurantiacus]MBL0420178.1 sulfatase-like hydrolase/transferase [Ramlibacter aurantiacus]
MSTRPNFIFILADDLGWADLGCTGARDVMNQPVDVSPNLDRLAAQGLRCTHGYSNSAVCSPTRFALMTGRWQYRLRGAAEEPIANAKGDKILGLPPEHPSLPSLLGQAGYRTALVGKWHLGYPPHFGPRLSGYQEYFGFHSGGVDYFAHTGPRGGHDLWDNETEVQREGYMTDLLSRRAVDFVERQSGEQPFLLSLHYSAPHWPWLTRDDAEESRRTATHGVHTDGGSLATYHRMIHHMDEGIGWLLDALERKGLAEDTLVVFTSDNGGERFSNVWPFAGQKMDLLEGGIRVPLIARWPARIAAGQVSDCPSLTMDWTATMLAAGGAGIPASHPLDGVDLQPLFADAAWRRPGVLAWRMKHRGQRALVQDGWKYLHMDGIDYLFNLNVDARERANLARREPGRLATLKALWESWNDELPPIPEDAKAYGGFSAQEIPRGTF